MKAFIVISFVSFIGSLQAADQWSYDYQTQWPGYCRTGLQQSPINIMTSDALLDVHEAHIRGPLVFRGYERVNFTARNVGHALQWDVVPNGPKPVLSGGPLRGNYNLVSFHLHWLSEHAIDGMKYPIEIHMVHVKQGLTLAEAIAGPPDAIAAVAILCQVHTGGNSEYAFEEIMPVVPSLTNRTEKPVPASFIDVSRLLGPNRQSFYTYQGSITTPPCPEVVTWTIMDKPVHISDDQFKQFVRVNLGSPDNYRNLQPVNRVVYRSIASCSTMLTPSYLGLLATTIGYLASNVSSILGKGLCIVSNIKKKIFGDKLLVCKLAAS